MSNQRVDKISSCLESIVKVMNKKSVAGIDEYIFVSYPHWKEMRSNVELALSLLHSPDEENAEG